VNARKLALALRMAAEALEELEPQDDTRKRSRSLVRPAGENDALAAARAKRILRDHGFAEKKP
jgi:hypothetical protein